MKTKITEILGIRYPIIQGGMAWVAEAKLAAAVSNGGGCGLIAGGSAPADYIRNEIRKARELTDKPFGLNIMLMSPHAADLAQLVIDEGVKIVTTGAGNPGKYISAWKEAGIKIIPVIPSAALAKRMERAGADAVVAEGMEAGGHIGQITTMSLIPAVVDAVNIPVIAAGGIGDERGVCAAFALGAQGVQVGTRFLVANECVIHENYRNMVLGAKESDTVVTGAVAVRTLKNKLTRKISSFEGTNEEFEEMTVGSLRKAVIDGDLEEGSFMCGQIAGIINKAQPAAGIIEEMFGGLARVYQEIGGLING